MINVEVEGWEGITRYATNITFHDAFHLRENYKTTVIHHTLSHKAREAITSLTFRFAGG